MAKNEQEKGKVKDRAVIVDGEITADTVKKIVAIVAIVVVGWIAFQGYTIWQMGKEVSLGEVVKVIKDDKVSSVVEQGGMVLLQLKDNTREFAQIGSKTDFPTVLHDANIDITTVNYKPNNADPSALLLNIAAIVLMSVIAYGVWNFVRAIRKQAGAGNDMLSFGKSNAAVIIGKRPSTTFKDVAGAKEAKEEISEIVEFLRNPKEFFAMGARIPRGVMLVGSPGTGKTLLARAVAGEAKVPFFHTSGPEFEEMLVGAGAARVRDLFKRAKNLAPSIIFIDEIDAVARRRGSDYKASNSEQTLNQILVEMDGFEKRDAVIVIAATNRPDVLDPAIMRPGRFDRNIQMSLPDVGERLEILQVHAKNKKFEEGIDFHKIAQFTVGFSGADLENVLNEAAILAVRAKQKEITQADIKEATLRVSMGPRRGSMMTTAEDLNLTAYHEAGHAIVGAYMKDAEPVTVITIIPRGDSLGMTVYSSETDNHNKTKAQLLARLASSTGGRVAEELVFGPENITVGASGDIESVTKIASAMVKMVGMSDSVGFVQYDKNEDFDMFAKKTQYSDETAKKMDEEVRRLIDQQYEVARTILKRERKLLDAVAAELLKKETLNEQHFKELIEKYGTEKAPDKEKLKSLSVTDWIKSKQDPQE